MKHQPQQQHPQQAGHKAPPIIDDPPETIEGEALKAELVGGPVKPAAAKLSGPLLKFFVSLNCPTPLAHRELEVEARSAEEAREKFCEANNISGSNHDWKITPVSSGHVK